MLLARCYSRIVPIAVGGGRPLLGSEIIALLSGLLLQSLFSHVAMNYDSSAYGGSSDSNVASARNLA